VSHFLLLVIYAFQLSLFFALLWRRQRDEQIKLFLQLLVGLVLGAIAVGWLMYPFPAGPPAPFP
jgi:cytochrome bd-type quinol oxidase subunit 2